MNNPKLLSMLPSAGHLLSRAVKMLFLFFMITIACSPDAFAVANYVMTMQQTAEGMLAPPGQTTFTGAALNIAASANAGYKLKNWTATPSGNATFGNATSSNTTITLTGDVTVSAVFESVFTLTIGYTPAGGGSVTPVSGQVTPNTPIAITSSPAGGYLFTKWTASPAANATFADATQADTTVSLSGNATVNANFAKGCFLTPSTLPAFSPDAWGSTTPAAVQTVGLNTLVPITATPIGGNHVFSGWTATPSANAVFTDSSSAITTVKLSGDATIYANFSASYTLKFNNLSGLDSGTYTPYVLGFSTNSMKMLTVADGGTTGTFTAMPNTSGFVPSFSVGSDITSITVSNTNELVGTRIYFFMKKKGLTYNDNSVTNPDGSVGGPQFSYSGSGAYVTQCNNPPQTDFPIFNYVELTFKANQDMYMDVSSVDGFFFPVTITATNSDGSQEYRQVGQPLIPSMTGEGIVNTYQPFMDGITAGGEDAGAYLDLYTVPREASFQGLLNPSLYLQTNASMGSSLHTVFDNALNEIFTATAFYNNISLWQNGTDKYNDFFTATGVTATFPGTSNTHAALKFTGASTKKVYTVFNPVGFSMVNYKDAGGAYHPITGTIKSNVLTFDNPIPAVNSQLTVGMYVSSGGGSTDGTTTITTINTTAGNIVSVKLNSSTDYSSSFQYMFSKAPTHYYYSSGCMAFSGNGLLADGGNRSDTTAKNDQTVINGIENQIVSALNRGVAVVDYSGVPGAHSGDGHTTDNWATETNWYPKSQPQNFFSLFMHTAKIGADHIFTLPDGAVKSARNVDYMAMSYGFSYDENPIHSIPGPQVPSEFPVPLPAGTTTLMITLGQWSTTVEDAQLTMSVNDALGGTVVPAVGAHAQKVGDNVPVTATPNAGYQFGRWNVSGCTVDKPGSATGATVAVTGTTATASANFAKIVDISGIVGGGTVSVPNLADSTTGMKNIFVFNVTTEKNITLTTSGGTGDCDIYLKQGMAPNLADYQYKSTRNGTSEVVTVANPTAGDWYALLYSSADFANVTLDIEVDNSIPDKPVLTGSLSGTKVNLSWTATGDVYDIYRNATNSSSTATVIQADTATLTYQEAFSGIYYYYWVKAKKEVPGNPGTYLESDFSNVANPTGPDVITKVLKSGTATTGISGAISSIKTYQIDVPANQALLEIKAYGGTGTYDMDAGLDGNPEKYRALVDNSNEIIRIVNPVAGSYLIHLYGRTEYSGVAVVATYYGAAPIPVTGLTVSQGTFPNIILGWKDSPGATYYEIWRSTTKRLADASKIGVATDNSYEDNTNLITDVVYYYWIKAANYIGISKESASVSGFMLKKPAAAPTGVKAGNLDFDKISVTWSKCTNATSYLVYRNTVNSSDAAALLAEVASVSYATTYSYDDMGDTLAMGSTYYYFIKAKNGSGTSGFSLGDAGNLNNKGPASATASDGTYYGKVMINWAAVAGATGYDVYRYLNKDLSDVPQIFDAGAELSYDDAAAVKNTTYYYRVKAKYKAVYTSLFSPSNSGFHNDNVESLSAPSMKSATKGDFGFVRVIWSAVTLAENYKVYRNTVNTFGSSALLTTTANTSYDDAAAVPDTTYWYWVKANNDTADATSVPSNSMSGFAKSASTVIADGGSATTDGAIGSYKFYALDVPASTTRLVATLAGTSTTNSCDLYVKLASYPTLSSYNAKGTDTGTGKTLTVTNPAQGTWYILLYGKTAFTNVTLNVQCYSVSDIVITEYPANNGIPPFTLKIKGKVVDKAGKGIPGLSLQARDPITGNTTWLSAKTDASGVWSFSGKVDREGAHAFDFFFTGLPDLAKGTGTHTVFTRKDCWEPGTNFDFSSYMQGITTGLNLVQTIGMQDYLNIRSGWETGAIDTDYEDLWIAATLGKAPSDTAMLNNMDDGLYLLFYAFDGTGCGNDLVATSALRPYPLLVHVIPGNLSTILGNLNALGIIGDTQKEQILAGKTGIVSVAALSNPGEDVSNDRDVSLIAREQLETLMNLAANNSSVSFVEDRKFGDVMTKVIKIKVDENTHEFNVATECFIK